MQALQARFSPEAPCVERQAEVVRLHRRLELVDAEARLQNDLSLVSFIAGFRLACGIAHELGLEPPYSFRQEEEEQISGR